MRRSILYLAVMPTIMALAVVAPFSVSQGVSMLQVDHDDYRAVCTAGKGDDCSYKFTLIATYQNRRSDTVYVDRCKPLDRTPKYDIEPFPDTTQRAAYARMWACVRHDSPIVIPPRATRVDTLKIVGPRAWDGRTNSPLGKLEGDFRLVYEVRPCHGGRPNCLASSEFQSSQAFRVRLAVAKSAQ